MPSVCEYLLELLKTVYDCIYVVKYQGSGYYMEAAQLSLLSDR